MLPTGQSLFFFLISPEKGHAIRTNPISQRIGGGNGIKFPVLNYQSLHPVCHQFICLVHKNNLKRKVKMTIQPGAIPAVTSDPSTSILPGIKSKRTQKTLSRKKGNFSSGITYPAFTAILQGHGQIIFIYFTLNIL